MMCFPMMNDSVLQAARRHRQLQLRAQIPSEIQLFCTNPLLRERLRPNRAHQPGLFCLQEQHPEKKITPYAEPADFAN
jgi:hypothetical protein